jgi:hypothetical protein
MLDGCFSVTASFWSNVLQAVACVTGLGVGFFYKYGVVIHLIGANHADLNKITF